MSISIKFIGAFRHLSGKKELTIHFQDGYSIKSVVDSISQELPQLKRISILEGYETKLNDGDEIIFVPVVHGG